MAQTGESYATARREVIREFRAATSSDPAGEPEWFAISYKDMGPISTWTDTLLGGGPAGGRIEVGAGELRLRMADFEVDVPRASVRREPATEPWGLTEMWIEDPDGVRIVLVEVPAGHPLCRDPRPASPPR
jgi:hypothetical protein